jgi:hypothetical protein
MDRFRVSYTEFKIRHLRVSHGELRLDVTRHREFLNLATSVLECDLIGSDRSDLHGIGCYILDSYYYYILTRSIPILHPSWIIAFSLGFLFGKFGIS